MDINTHTITTALLTPEGLYPAPYQATSIQEAAKYEPPGVYTVARTYHRTYTLELDAHLDRLEESAHLLGVPLRLKRQAVRAALRELINQAGYPESRFRITVPRAQPDQAYFAIEPLNGVPPEVRAGGVRVRTVTLQRDNPRAKHTSWMALRAEIKEQVGDTIYEVLLSSPDGLLLEGMSSNFYAILDGQLRTASDGILHGISRRIVLEVAPDVLPVVEQPVAREDIPRLGEAFLSSSSRGVIPVVEIDGQPVGDGRPGPLTRAIEGLYDAWAEAHLEPL